MFAPKSTNRLKNEVMNTTVHAKEKGLLDSTIVLPLNSIPVRVY